MTYLCRRHSDSLTFDNAFDNNSTIKYEAGRQALGGDQIIRAGTVLLETVLVCRQGVWIGEWKY